MLRNHLTTTIRSWRKSPAHSILNITGLALGIACAALILLWVEDELIGITRSRKATGSLWSG